VDNGYATLKQGNDRDGAPFAEASWMQAFDWSKTQAYSVGLSSLYINTKGREREGIVDAAASGALIAEIKAKLMGLKDPKTGKNVFSAIYSREVYRGEALAEAPDISLGYAEAYQSSKDCIRGGVGKELFEPNDDKWSGEHASSDAARVPGILFSSKPVKGQNPHIVDMGVTTLGYLGVKAPADYEGKSLL
jgi:predicted AlkP superfamily phosphohydrolase/phosphomutase